MVELSQEFTFYKGWQDGDMVLACNKTNMHGHRLDSSEREPQALVVLAGAS